MLSNEKYKGDYGGMFLDGDIVSDSYFVKTSALIAKVEILDEPVEYKVDYTIYNSKSYLVTLGFRAKILKIFYSDSPEKKGHIIKILANQNTYHILTLFRSGCKPICTKFQI
jgi:hypothetical protein